MQSSQARTTSRRTFGIQLDVPRVVVVLLLLGSLAEVRSRMPCTLLGLNPAECGYDGCPSAACYQQWCWGPSIYSAPCPEAPCPAGTFNSVSSCVSGGLGRGGGTECFCTTCPAGEMIDIAIPSFPSMPSDFVCTSVTTRNMWPFNRSQLCLCTDPCRCCAGKFNGASVYMHI
jgi:hypothetical protein